MNIPQSNLISVDTLKGLESCLQELLNSRKKDENFPIWLDAEWYCGKIGLLQLATEDHVYLIHAFYFSINNYLENFEHFINKLFSVRKTLSYSGFISKTTLTCSGNVLKENCHIRKSSLIFGLQKTRNWWSAWKGSFYRINETNKCEWSQQASAENTRRETGQVGTDIKLVQQAVAKLAGHKWRLGCPLFDFVVWQVQNCLLLKRLW